MTIVAGVALALWLLAVTFSAWVWLPAGAGPWSAQRTGRTARIAVLVILALLAAAAAVLAVGSGPLAGPWRWLAGGIAATVAVLGGGAVTTSILGLAGSAAPTTARVQRDVLRGGAWIGALERLALLGTLLAGWPEGLAVIVAVKGLARYPELRSVSGAGTGANERFIIGTFASLGWAAACAWVLTVMI
jgi:hypothetical protein